MTGATARGLFRESLFSGNKLRSGKRTAIRRPAVGAIDLAPLPSRLSLVDPAIWNKRLIGQ